MSLFYMSSSSKSAFNKPLSAMEKQSKEVWTNVRLIRNKWIVEILKLGENVHEDYLYAD